MIKQQDKIYLFLSCLEVSYKKAEIILSMYNDYDMLSKDIQNGKKELCEIFGKNFDKVKEKQKVFDFDVLANYFERKNIKILTLANDDYPTSACDLC